MNLGDYISRGLPLQRLAVARLMGKGVWFPAILVISLLTALPSFAQINRSEILGSVRDTSGGVIPNAIVAITNTQTNVSNTLKTDNAGAYALPDLVPGAYTVRVSVQGFQTAVHSGIELGVGKQLRIDVVLEPGTLAQTVTVTGTPM